MTTNNMHNLTTLIKRLEAATLRLEDIASSTIELPRAVPALQQTLASPLTSTPVPPPPPPPKAPEDPLPAFIEEYDGIIEQSVQKFAKLSDGIDGLVGQEAAKFVQGSKELRKFLLITTKAKKPEISGNPTAPSTLQTLLKPIQELILAVQHTKESNRASPSYIHLSVLSEGMMVLAWITIENKPYKHVEEIFGTVQYYGNQILKDKNPRHVEWVRSFYQVFRDLAEYVKNYFPNGVTWNPKGLPADEVAKSLSSSGGPPPPPPPPPPGPPPVLQIHEQKSESKPAGGFGAVFSELNQGDAVTKGLKKVDKSQMTHKNPSLRASSTVPDGAVRSKSPAPGKKPKPENMRVKKPPKKALEGNKWLVENFEAGEQPIEIEVENSHSILISKCSNTTIILRGKANAVTIENSNRLNLVLDDLISSVDVVKSQNFALQVMGVIPTILMDQIDGAQIYLSKESTATRVFSSKSSGINLNIISGQDDESKELPLPSQICSYYDEEKGGVVNEIVSHSS
ncbi:adenylate cyclase associated N terminal-domain-containing protein [Rhypophila decipiens]|uniref:Adenylyl cyclase-associated protein n=1 Tax=Rhypophila decipiens TaxID=261697 RepID=A0AAN7B9D8_9PEZI|nr:adenylate cyclase associated N terminal-domain-containing protein [Rhypophila decipiens]